MCKAAVKTFVDKTQLEGDMVPNRILRVRKEEAPHCSCPGLCL